MTLYLFLTPDTEKAMPSSSPTDSDNCNQWCPNKIQLRMIIKRILNKSKMDTDIEKQFIHELRY